MVFREEGDGVGARSEVEEALRITRRRGDRFGTAYSILGLACLTTDEGDWRHAAELHGIAQACLDHIGQPWLAWLTYRDDSIHTICEQLGNEDFERSFARGRSLDFEGAIRVALAEKSDHDLLETPGGRS